MSAKIEEVIICATQAGISADKIAILRKELEELEAEKRAERDANKDSKSKNKYTILVRGPKELEAMVQQGWIVKTALDQDDGELVDRIKRGATRHNNAQKRRKSIISTFRDFFLLVKRKWTKEQDVAVQVVTREPVRVIVLEEEKI